MYTDEVVCDFCYLIIRRNEANRITSPLKRGKDTLNFCRDSCCAQNYFKKELKNGNEKL